MSEELVTVTTNATNSTFNWANEWLGYMALGMFSMVLLVPTLGIVGLMVWEYFSDEAERKAERHREIEQVVSLTFFFNSVHHVMHFPQQVCTYSLSI
jgi:hypothetical protein